MCRNVTQFSLSNYLVCCRKNVEKIVSDNLIDVIVNNARSNDCWHSANIAVNCFLHCNQWRRYEFESGGTRLAQSAGKSFFSRACHFLALKAQFVFVSDLIVTVSDGAPSRAQPFVKVGARALRALWSRRH